MVEFTSIIDLVLIKRDIQKYVYNMKIDIGIKRMENLNQAGITKSEKLRE